MERWKICARYPKYEISDYGRVRLLRTGKLRVPTLNLHNGRPHRLRMKFQRAGGSAGDRESRSIHILVLEAFVGPCPPGREARHLDGDCQNNYYENLCWGTHLENTDDSIRHGTFRLNEASR